MARASTCNYGCSPLPFCQKPKRSVLLSLSYLLLGGEKEDAAVGEGAGESVLLVRAGKSLLLVGTSCCTEPSLEASHTSPALAGSASLAWVHLGWDEMGLHSLLLPWGFSLGLFSLPPTPEPHQARTPPSALQGCAKLGQPCWRWRFGCRKAAGGCGDNGGLQQPRGCGEPLLGAWWMRAEQPDRPSAFPPPFPLQTWARLFNPSLAPSLPLPSYLWPRGGWPPAPPASPAWIQQVETCGSPGGTGGWVQSLGLPKLLDEVV